MKLNVIINYFSGLKSIICLRLFLFGLFELMNMIVIKYFVILMRITQINDKNTETTTDFMTKFLMLIKSSPYLK